MPVRVLNLIALATLAACAAGGPASPGYASSASSSSSSEAGRTQRLSFRSDPWMNLHHFLYQWARAEQGLGSGRSEVIVPERDRMGELSVSDRQVWERAVTLYRTHLAELGHFDRPMLIIKSALLRIPIDAGAVGSVVPTTEVGELVPGLSATLGSAMEVYARSWWPEHDRANREWVVGVLREARRYEDEYVRVSELSYGGVWPDRRVRVDASAYANWQGGYTSNRPTHVVIWSTDPGVQGLYALELVYHEVAHTSSLATPNREALDSAFAAVGKEPPANLWHAMIFYTSGSTTRRIAEERGLPAHVPYMVREGLVDFGGWTGLWPALEEHWGPFLAGRSTRALALAGLARDLG